jgi:sigma-54 dependent transcriptional regulator, acetoin dehydrogenase operon transcriptional activator AcoR
MCIRNYVHKWRSPCYRTAGRASICNTDVGAGSRMLVQLPARGRKAWEQYLSTGVLDERVVRGSVARSWQRCRGLRVNPVSSADDYEAEGRRLEQRRYDKRSLIRVAQPFLLDLAGLVRGTDFQVILADENGYLLEIAGDPRIVQRAREVHLCAGADWRENCKGTNAIGVAIVENAPVQIHAWEHFREENHFLTCSAAPIIDPDGKRLGVIDISGDFRQANPHTLGMVTATVRAIENQLRLERATTRLRAASGWSHALVQGFTEGLLAVDNDGIVMEINSRAGEILGISAASARGSRLDEVYRGEAPILQVVRTGKEYRDQEIAVDRSGRRAQSSASLLRDQDGEVVGAVAFLRELQRLQVTRRAPVCFSHRYQFDDIVGSSLAIQTAREWASLAATCNSTVLLLGDSGTGKELFANAIHHASARSRGPFLAINCAAMPESLIESELFGYSDGSFTGAKKGGQPGKFEMAGGGTIFLDEIGEMSLSMQAKLLRVLQERTVSRIGSSAETNVDIRVVAATHCDLPRDVELGRFREDLYYRLAVLEVKIPPLRERKEDIPALARSLIAKLARRLDRSVVTINADALEKLASYSWPGNVREMENVLERALIRARPSITLQPEHIDIPANGFRSATPVIPQGSRKLQAVAVREPAKPAAPTRLRDVEKHFIAEALSASRGNIKRTAAQLGIARNTLYRKMQEFGLEAAALKTEGFETSTLETTESF